MNYLDKRYLEIVDSCPKCHGQNSACTCFLDYSLEIKKFKSNIPPMFCSTNLSTITLSDKQLDVVNQFLSGSLLGVYLEGGSKLKRARLLTAVLGECLKRDKTCLFINATDSAQSVMGRWYGADADTFGKLLNSDIVGFSDVGDERQLESDSRVVEDSFDYVIRERLLQLRSLIISSSMKVEDFAKKYLKEREELLAENFRVLTFHSVNVQEIFKEIRR